LVTVNGRPPAQADLKKQSENDMNAQQITGSSPARADNRENFLTRNLWLDIISR
jgi:hypothetical protein